MNEYYWTLPVQLDLGAKFDDLLRDVNASGSSSKSILSSLYWLGRRDVQC